MKTAIDLVEKGLIPDLLVRLGIRRLLRRRLHEARDIKLVDLLNQLRNSPIAVVPEKANEQHYEVPPEFFQLVLGKRLKYSGCYWSESVVTLDQAEEAMLELCSARAQLADGQDVLDLGCGWGSFSLWMAERFPNSRIVGVSNSAPQRKYILGECARRAIKNLEIMTCDMNIFAAPREFDRIVSVEMFEHMRNYEELFSRVAHWLKSDGKLFVHVFCHKELAYPFEDAANDDWMARYFFSGGIMPSENLYSHFQKDIRLLKCWPVDGTHYGKTAEAWLKNLDDRRGEVLKVFKSAYGPDSANLWVERWRIFFLSCAELFSYKKGEEWEVAHYLFEKV